MQNLETSSPRILAAKGDGIGWLTFNQPEKRNAMSLDMWQATGEVLESFGADDEVRVVVMQGAGDRAFVSGADISQFEKHRSNAEASAEYNRIAGHSRKMLAMLDKPLIAKIRGYCIGGGLAVALAADFRIASEDSQFGIPAAKLSIVYPYDGIRLLKELVGPGNAKKILFSGFRYPAAEALRMGLIEEVTPVEELDAVVRNYAETIAGNAPLSINGTKQAIREMGRNEADRDLDRLAALQTEAMNSADYAEGRRAFMEKRKPVFTGT
ncbi:enoyl-CoA hydratase [Pseudooceanicola sp. 216_PA32_1]|uniref:Enoyl-CoA hydratase n=1 Tax=Pseudooceanicola pacificus TaxID=2676438 RepID=A0A844WBJ8_9RHOB|nr:enoyl-CoA hydratase [Pseudooceanicola pacificus]MWB77342.1 enoyl-CoA hydratase [Pseudooceanicola pacificus]